MFLRVILGIETVVKTFCTSVRSMQLFGVEIEQ